MSRGDEEVGEGDFFQIVDPEESTAFDDGSQLGLAGNQVRLCISYIVNWPK